MPKLDDSLKPEIVKWSAFYEHRIGMGSKVIFHLVAFVAKVMRVYEGYVPISFHDLVDKKNRSTDTVRTQFCDGMDIDDDFDI